jgi:hypothetical protein
MCFLTGLPSLLPLLWWMSLLTATVGGWPLPVSILFATGMAQHLWMPHGPGVTVMMKRDRAVPSPSCAWAQTHSIMT